MEGSGGKRGGMVLYGAPNVGIAKYSSGGHCSGGRVLSGGSGDGPQQGWTRDIDSLAPRAPFPVAGSLLERHSQIVSLRKANGLSSWGNLVGGLARGEARGHAGDACSVVGLAAFDGLGKEFMLGRVLRARGARRLGG